MSLAAFVIPHLAETPARSELLRRTLDSLRAQTDPDWICIVSDDASPLYDGEADAKALIGFDDPRIIVTRSLRRSGAGACRNRAVRLAKSLNAEIVLHLDDDDIAHPKRVEVTRQIISRSEGRPFVYSPFTVIDDEDNELPSEEVRLDMLEVMEQLAAVPLEGDDVFEAMVAQTGFIAALSSVAVRTKDALNFPFPFGRASDDSHTWMRLAASGARFIFARDIPFKYRVPGDRQAGTCERVRSYEFLEEKAYNDIDGFECGVVIGLSRGRLAEKDVPALTAAFLARLARTVARQGHFSLAESITNRSFNDGLVRRLVAV